MSSDHCPLLTKLNPPLRFHTIWMQHESYDDLISETWMTISGDIISKSHGLAAALKIWNKETFGNIFYQKKKKRDCMLAILE